MTAIEAIPGPPTHFGLVKMEERKRPSPYDQNDLAPPSKKQATSTNGAFKNERDVDMHYQKDVEVSQDDIRMYLLCDQD